MSTERLWMDSTESCYQKTFEAEVTAVSSDSIQLNRTCFYPIGGGQPWDLGYLSGNNKKIPVIEVRGRDNIDHYVSKNHGFEIGDTVFGELDWDRRHTHMRMHTTQHLISALAYDMFGGLKTVGNQISFSKSRIDFNPASFSKPMLDSLKKETNNLISSNLPVKATIMNREEINDILPKDRTNMDLIPSFIDELRVIIIGDNIDICPCAGTHISSLKEIGKIDWIGGPKSKGKGTQRITYELIE